MKYLHSLIFIGFVFVLLFPQFIYAIDRAETDTTDTLTQVQNPVDNDGDGEEIILDDIEIIGQVEKPGVIIFPKRIEPELPEVELERSFQRELKEGMGEFVKPDDELSQIENVQSIKKAIEKKRE